MVGLCHMQVCAMADASDEEILEVCNRENPSGTTNGWTKVIRDNKDDPDNFVPVVCGDFPERLHILVAC
jgi:hypothetical protein